MPIIIHIYEEIQYNNNNNETKYLTNIVFENTSLVGSFITNALGICIE